MRLFLPFFIRPISSKTNYFCITLQLSFLILWEYRDAATLIICCQNKVFLWTESNINRKFTVCRLRVKQRQQTTFLIKKQSIGSRTFPFIIAYGINSITSAIRCKESRIWNPSQPTRIVDIGSLSVKPVHSDTFFVWLHITSYQQKFCISSLIRDIFGWPRLNRSEAKP